MLSTLSLDKTLYKKGDKATLKVFHKNVDKFSTIQIEIYNTGNINAKSVLGFGRPLHSIAKDEYAVEINTDLLPP